MDSWGGVVEDEAGGGVFDLVMFQKLKAMSKMR